MRAPRPTILLVEDYEANILVASCYLDSFGYHYEVARSGTQAVEKFKSRVYDSVLMDVRMPELDGFEATQLIRQHEALHDRAPTPIIGMTAYALSGDKERCIAAGMDDYIAKPVSEAELKHKLRLYVEC